MKKTFAVIASFGALAFPLIVSAQALTPLLNLIQALNIIVSRLVPLLMALALVAFFYGLVKYVWGGKGFQESGRNIMIAGLGSLFVMASVWGIIALAQSALGVQNPAGISVPSVPVGGSR